MSSYRTHRVRPSFSFSVTPVVKKLLIATCIVFVLQAFFGGRFTYLFAFIPSKAVFGLMAWQFLTYMFLHGSFLHILFNMLMLWMFGMRLELRLGSREFLSFYLTCGAGAALVHFLASFALGETQIPMIGASGAVYGILLASAMFWGEQVVYIYGIFPMKTKYMVLILGGLALWASISMVAKNTGGNIAHFAHLGGLLTAWLYLRYGGWGKFRQTFRTKSRPAGPRRIRTNAGHPPPYSDEDTWR
jgi:membrane associated rhomboid family serine protease